MDEEVVRWLPEIIPHLHLVQLGDARHSPLGEMNRCLLGDGSVPLHTILGTLRDHDYQGPLEVELIGEDVETISYDQLLDHTRDFIDRTWARLENTMNSRAAKAIPAGSRRSNLGAAKGIR